MKWFKHFSDMKLDRKLKKLIRKHSLLGYGFYNYVLETISLQLTPESPIPELEEEIEDLALDLNMDELLLNDILNECITLELFDINKENNRIRCMKLLEHLDNTLSVNPEIKKILNNYNKLKETSSDFKQLKVNKSNLNKLKVNKSRLDKNTQDEIIKDKVDKIFGETKEVKCDKSQKQASKRVSADERVLCGDALKYLKDEFGYKQQKDDFTIINNILKNLDYDVVEFTKLYKFAYTDEIANNWVKLNLFLLNIERIKAKLATKKKSIYFMED